MSYQAIQISNNQPLVTTFYGGADRGKVMQFHLLPSDLVQLRTVTVYDRDSELVSTLEEWVAVKMANTNVVFFDRDAEPKISTIQIEKVR